MRIVMEIEVETIKEYKDIMKATKRAKGESAYFTFKRFMEVSKRMNGETVTVDDIKIQFYMMKNQESVSL